MCKRTKNVLSAETNFTIGLLGKRCSSISTSLYVEPLITPVQIISPHDKGISAAIKANLEPSTWDVSALSTSALCIDRTAEMTEAYFAALSTLCTARALNARSPLVFVNTSMHGVSDPFVAEAFRRFGFAPFVPVAEQQRPDPEFPTVRFPNPEEAGAYKVRACV